MPTITIVTTTCLEQGVPYPTPLLYAGKANCQVKKVFFVTKIFKVLGHKGLGFVVEIFPLQGSKIWQPPLYGHRLGAKLLFTGVFGGSLWKNVRH